MSMDLIDFNGRSDLRYILVVIDNFSRYMMTVALTDKTAAKTAVGYGRCSTRLNPSSATPTFLLLMTAESSRAP